MIQWNGTQNQQPTMRMGSSDETNTCTCGKILKNARGLKIHRAKMKCETRERMSQRRVDSTCEAAEDLNQETHHSVQSSQVTASEEVSISENMPSQV